MSTMMDNCFDQGIESMFQMYGPYPLHRAAELGHKNNLCYLLENGMSPNQTNYDCLTPLHEACIHGQVECAEILINHGAEVNARSIDGGTPLCDACATGSLQCVELLMKNGAEVNPPLVLTTPLHEACLKGNLDCTRMLIKAGAKLNVNDCNFGTPLHAATVMNHPTCVKMLLEAGAFVDAAKIHQTALHVAAMYNYSEVAEVLLEFGANVFASNNQNKLPIDLLSKPEGRLYTMLKKTSTQPVKLKDLCRRRIRSTLGSRKIRLLKNLQLPKLLILYLMHKN